MLRQIHNCYDSHTHFSATGQVALGLQLQSLSSAAAIDELRILPEYYRGHWITGFGWDQIEFPNEKILDQVFPETPVLFSRADGHTSWINSKAYHELVSLGFKLQSANFNGILQEQDHIKALTLLPNFTDIQQKSFLVESQKIFNQAGFTHVRDLSMNLNTWNLLSQLQREKNLTVCLDTFVTSENLSHLDQVFSEISEMQKNPCPQLKIHGVKIFIDGSLGSKSAYLSENYLGSNSSGVLTWSLKDIKTLMTQVWQKGLDVAVHTIGDQAVHEVVQIARQISADGILGRLHLEHVEVLRPETIQLMKPLHITCYLQPCHWLSDEKWLKQILPKTLLSNIFQWELLRKNKIPFFFGSDSPIEKPSLWNTQKALLQSAEYNVPTLQADWTNYHSHPDANWNKGLTELSDEKVEQVYLNGESLI